MGALSEGITGEVFHSSAERLFKMCNKTRQYLQTQEGRRTDSYLHSGGAFRGTVSDSATRECSLCPQALFLQDLSGQRLASAFPRAADHNTALPCCSRKQSLLNHGAVSFTEPRGSDSHMDLVLEGLNCCSLLDYLASPCFLKLSHFLLGTCAINSSWAGASYVLFQTLL